MKPVASLSALPDADLITEIKRLAMVERGATADVIAALAEVDARRLYLGQGCSSLFIYCTRVLLMSEHAAYNRIEAARVARRCPFVFDALRSGSVTLTTLTLMAPHLTPENQREMLDRVHRRSKRDVEIIVAELRPRPDVPTLVRRLAAPRTVAPVDVASAGEAPIEAQPADGRAQIQQVPPAIEGAVRPTPPVSHPVPPPSHKRVVAPLTPERFKVQFTVSRETHDRLRHAQALMRHTLPTGDVGAIFERALSLLVQHLEKQKAALVARPRGDTRPPRVSRDIPAAVRREVWHRDGARCAFVGPEGRCTETGWLEFHHVEPHGFDGLATTENIQLRCRAHNQHEAREVFGSLMVREVSPRYLPGRGERALGARRAVGKMGESWL